MRASLAPLASLVLVCLQLAARSCGASTPEAPAEQLVDDSRQWLKPSISTSELLRARGYLAREHKLVTRDKYILSLVRATNPLVNDGQRGLASKLPILFVNAATLGSSSYLANSVGVKPRFHRPPGGLGQLSVTDFKRLIEDDPARRSLPFLALNLGYECWFLDRRGFAGSRKRVGDDKRTLRDALKALPRAMLGNVLDGFSLNANLVIGRPARVDTNARDKATANQNGTIVFEAAKAPGGERNFTRARHLLMALDDLNHLQSPDNEQQAAKVGRGNSARGLSKGADSARRGPNLLQLMFWLAKLLGVTEYFGDIQDEFVETFNPEFWKYTLDQQAEIDLPQAMEFVLEATGAPKLHLLGLSCGGAVILMGLAENPELAHKISRAVLWAPSVNLGSKSDMVFQLSRLVPIGQGYSGPLPFTFLARPLQHLFQWVCSSELMQVTICEALVDVVGGFSGSQQPSRPFFGAVFFSPTSFGEFAHLGQMARTQRPCKFSHNTKAKNLKHYGHFEPPCYDLARIQLHNMSFYVGAYDTLVSPDDIATTELQMSVASELHIIKGERLFFNHFGALLHKNNDELVIIPSLLDMERSQEAAQREHQSQHNTPPDEDPSDNSI